MAIKIQELEEKFGSNSNKVHLEKAAESSVKQLYKPLHIAKEYCVDNNDKYKNDFLALLYQIGDYYQNIWWKINDDFSVTFFHFLPGSIPQFPALYNPNISLSSMENEIIEKSYANPAYDLFKTFKS